MLKHLNDFLNTGKEIPKMEVEFDRLSMEEEMKEINRLAMEQIEKEIEEEVANNVEKLEKLIEEASDKMLEIPEDINKESIDDKKKYINKIVSDTRDSIRDIVKTIPYEYREDLDIVERLEAEANKVLEALADEEDVDVKMEEDAKETEKGSSKEVGDKPKEQKPTNSKPKEQKPTNSKPKETKPKNDPKSKTTESKPKNPPKEKVLEGANNEVDDSTSLFPDTAKLNEAPVVTMDGEMV